ncbi:hypothetical protein KC19_5G086900 [Ceratodon purpureus]|uniref:F-box domain-containing protein n=1 Tax=Ceratodon purpureus TaxID=3225 RepID=A0A8T0I0I1_CERPU|nr:hypothetical protein KC19_5G086900 [Ceratodon purpureus]
MDLARHHSLSLGDFHIRLAGSQGIQTSELCIANFCNHRYLRRVLLIMSFNVDRGRERHGTKVVEAFEGRCDAVIGDMKEEVAMDPTLWGNLKDYVAMEIIYAKVPFHKFFQLRLVCKEWNHLAGDRKFLEDHFILIIRKKVI